MPKRDADDPNLFAKSVLDQVIAKHDPEPIREQGKNPHAVVRGMKGGAKGGAARAKKLSASKRKSIAEKAGERGGKKHGRLMADLNLNLWLQRYQDIRISPHYPVVEILYSWCSHGHNKGVLRTCR